MPFSRNQRTDRRRRVMREAVAAAPEYAVESVRSKRRSRLRNQDVDTEEEEQEGVYRDPGYSHAVRRACQQRMVQFIPVRRSSLTLVLGSLWILWAGLVFAHYWIHIRTPVSITQPNLHQRASVEDLPQADSAESLQPDQHRSPASALATMRRKIFGNGDPASNDRTHPANDSSDVTLAGATAPVKRSPMSSGWNESAPRETLEPSLRMLPISKLFDLRSGNSIAHWLTSVFWLLTSLAAAMIFQLRRHKLDDYRAKYRIWIFMSAAALFSSFDASTSVLYLIGTSIDPWARYEIGVAGWPLVLASFASIVGVLGLRLSTELKTSRASVSLWIGGLIAWAISALLGTGLVRTQLDPMTVDIVVGACWLGGILAVFQATGIYLRQTYVHAQKRFVERQTARLSKLQWKMPKISFRRTARDEEDVHDDEERDSETTRRRWRLPSWKRSRASDELDAKPTRERSKPAANSSEDDERSELPSTEKRGWFGIKRSSDSETKSESKSKPESKSSTSDEKKGASTEQPAKRSFWSRRPKDETKEGARSDKSAARDGKSSEGSTDAVTKKKWLPAFGKKKAASEPSTARNAAVKAGAASSADSKSTQETKRGSWLSLGRSKDSSKDNDKEVAKKTDTATTAKRTAAESDTAKKRSLFGFLDGLKLKPPSESSNPAPSSLSNTTKPAPVATNRPLPSTQPSNNSYDEDDDDDDSNSSGRPMSKAERKRLRRMQQDDRRAA